MFFNFNPALNLQRGSANKDYQENNSYNNFTNNTNNKKLNNRKSEINCRDDVQINNKVATMSNRVSQNTVIVRVRITMEMKITLPIITLIMKRKHETKQLQESSKKTERKNVHLYLGQHSNAH